MIQAYLGSQRHSARRLFGGFVALALAMSACLTPLSEEPVSTGEDVAVSFEVKPWTDSGTAAAGDSADAWVSDLTGLGDGLSDAPELPDGVELSDATTADVSLPDASTGDVGLADAVTPAGDVTGTDAVELPWDDTIVAGATCSLFSSLGCAGGAQCFPDGKTNFCSPGGFQVTGQACVYFNDCVVGNFCVGGLCRALCDYTGQKPFTCAPGVTCDKLNVSGPVGPGIGVCHPVP